MTNEEFHNRVEEQLAAIPGPAVLTVSEMIQKLKSFPGDMRVALDTGDEYLGVTRLDVVDVHESVKEPGCYGSIKEEISGDSKEVKVLVVNYC